MTAFKAFRCIGWVSTVLALVACGTSTGLTGVSRVDTVSTFRGPALFPVLRGGIEDYYQSVGSDSGRPFLDSLNRVISKHRIFGYDEARDLMFGVVDDPSDSNRVECVYTGRVAAGVKDRDSANQNKLNAEHVWPQSKGAVGPGRTDLHHLFSSDMDANNRRSSYPMGHVEMVYWEAPQGDGTGQNSRLGKDASGTMVFEPRTGERGNVARALMYFYTVYGIGKNRPAVDLVNFKREIPWLLKWHEADPVDQTERDRHERVYGFQGNRNPYIDHPEWVFRVGHFL